jgi:predicted DNA-binding protein YlxM (UPF0122 family)
MKSKRDYNKKLTDAQIEFLVDYANLIQKWTLPTAAEAFGVTKQAVEYHQHKEAKRAK